MDLSARIRKAREHAGLTKSELARAVGVTPSAVTQWESGETKSLKADTLAKIAVATGCDPIWLATGKGKPWAVKQDRGDYNVRPVKRRPAIPVISWVQAGGMRDIDLIPDPQTGEWPTYEPDNKVGPRSWALVVEGDSMDDGTDKGIPEGWTIVVDPDFAYDAGRYVIAKDVDTQQATFKKLMRDGGRWYLKPLNPAYKTVEIDDPAVRVIGVVVEACPPARKLV